MATDIGYQKSYRRRGERPTSSGPISPGDQGMFDPGSYKPMPLPQRGDGDQPPDYDRGQHPFLDRWGGMWGGRDRPGYRGPPDDPNFRIGHPPPSDRGEGRAPIDRGEGTWQDKGWGGMNFGEVDWGGIINHFTDMDWQNMDWANMDWRSWLGGMPWSSWLGEGNWQNIQDRQKGSNWGNEAGENWRDRVQPFWDRNRRDDSYNRPVEFYGPPVESQPEMSEPERIPQHLQGSQAGWSYPNWLSKITSRR